MEVDSGSLCYQALLPQPPRPNLQQRSRVASRCRATYESTCHGPFQTIHVETSMDTPRIAAVGDSPRAGWPRRPARRAGAAAPTADHRQVAGAHASISDRHLHESTYHGPFRTIHEEASEHTQRIAAVGDSPEAGWPRRPAKRAGAAEPTAGHRQDAGARASDFASISGRHSNTDSASIYGRHSNIDCKRLHEASREHVQAQAGARPRQGPCSGTAAAAAAHSILGRGKGCNRFGPRRARQDVHGGGCAESGVHAPKHSRAREEGVTHSGLVGCIIQASFSDHHRIPHWRPAHPGVVHSRQGTDRGLSHPGVVHNRHGAEGERERTGGGQQGMGNAERWEKLNGRRGGRTRKGENKGKEARERSEQRKAGRERDRDGGREAGLQKDDLSQARRGRFPLLFSFDKAENLGYEPPLRGGGREGRRGLLGIA